MHQDQVARNTLTATHTRHKGNALFTNYHGLISNRAKDNKVLCFVVGLAEGHVDFQRPAQSRVQLRNYALQINYFRLRSP